MCFLGAAENKDPVLETDPAEQKLTSLPARSHCYRNAMERYERNGLSLLVPSAGAGDGPSTAKAWL
jgi:hypothetical protein